MLVYVSMCFYLSVCMCLCEVAYWGRSSIMCVHVHEYVCMCLCVFVCVYVSVCMRLCAVAYWGRSSIMAPMTSFQRSTFHPFLSLPPAAIAN